MNKEGRKRLDNIHNLYDNTIEIASIECTKCGTTKSEDVIAAESIYNEGWRSTRNNVYCPACANKFGIK